MGIFSKFEDRMEDTVEGAASRMSKAPISPVQIAKKAEKQMRRETMVGAGKEYAPTLYTVLVNPDDDSRLFGYYPTLAGETETYLSAKAAQDGLVMDGNPLVRFIVDDGLRHGKFEVIAEVVAAPIIAQLRQEEMERYGLAEPAPALAPAQRGQQRGGRAQGAPQGQRAPQPYDARPQAYDARPQQRQPQRQQPQPQPQPQPQQAHSGKPPLPYVPEDEIDRSIDYGEYTFNSEDFEDYRENVPSEQAPVAYNDAFESNYHAPNMFTPAGAAQGAGWGVSEDVGLAAGSVAASRVASGRAAGRHQRQHSQAPNTVAFAGGAGQEGVADHRAVRARLIDLTYQRAYDLAGTRLTLGRESGNDIKVQDISASRRHAELTLNPQGLWIITDLGSMNGTLVNGVSVASQPLYPGDVITIGKTEYEFALA